MHSNRTELDPVRHYHPVKTKYNQNNPFQQIPTQFTKPYQQSAQIQFTKRYKQTRSMQLYPMKPNPTKLTNNPTKSNAIQYNQINHRLLDSLVV